MILLIINHRQNLLVFTEFILLVCYIRSNNSINEEEFEGSRLRLFSGATQPWRRPTDPMKKRSVRSAT